MSNLLASFPLKCRASDNRKTSNFIVDITCCMFQAVSVMPCSVSLILALSGTVGGYLVVFE